MPSRAGTAPLAEIDVAHAPPEISDIYAEIAHLSGIPLPSLIWRHLATYPGVVSAAWHYLRPVYASGVAQTAAWGAVARVLDGRAAGPDERELRGAGLDADAILAYRRVLQSYNRANPVNFVGVRLLLAGLSSPVGAAQPRLAAAAVPTDRTWVPPAPIEGVVPMVAVPAIPADVRARIDALAIDVRIDRSQVVPSLYRHLVPWPALMIRIHEALSPLTRSGDLERLLAEVSDALQGEVDQLASRLGPLPPFDESDRVRGVLSQFSGLIPEMVVMGGLLERALSPEARLD